MQALRDLGNASLPALRRGIRRHDERRVQLRCAVVLHWLGQREGLPVLIDALRYGSRPPRNDNTDDIVECYLMIGSPDATQALIGVWQQLPSPNDNDPTAITICSIWRSLRDTSMLAALCETSIQTPRLFVETCSVFGADAIPELRKLSCDANPDRRAMALRGLEQIPGYASAQIVIPMLQDGKPEVRSLASTTLEAVSGPVTTLNALVAAHRAGFSTAVSVQMLIAYDPPELFSLLAGLLNRYNPCPGSGREPTQLQSKDFYPINKDHDTVDAVREAALIFSRCTWPHAQVTQILCGVVNRSVDPSIRTAVAQTIGERGRAGDDSDIHAYRAMWRQLTIVDKEARAAAAVALARLGEPIGMSFELLLEAGRPHGNILHKLHSTLVNSQDVGQAMSEAVQQVATWVNRMSRVTAKRFSSASTEGNPADAALIDNRVPELLRKMQANVLDSLETSDSEEITVEALSIGVGTLRAIARLNTAAAQLADAEIRRTYTIVKLIDSDRASNRTTNRTITSGATRGVRDDVAGVLRVAAGQALMDIYGSACFDILVGGLSHPEEAVKVTSAQALGRLGDRRAVPQLHLITDTGSPDAARAARDAVAAIRRGNPEMMTLLRSSSSADARPDTLLRPSTDVSESLSPELLLRPVHPGQPE